MWPAPERMSNRKWSSAIIHRAQASATAAASRRPRTKELDPALSAQRPTLSALEVRPPACSLTHLIPICFSSRRRQSTERSMRVTGNQSATRIPSFRFCSAASSRQTTAGLSPATTRRRRNSFNPSGLNSRTAARIADSVARDGRASPLDTRRLEALRRLVLCDGDVRRGRRAAGDLGFTWMKLNGAGVAEHALLI